MSSLLALGPAATVALAHPGMWGHGPGPWLFILIPLFWILVLGVVFALVFRRRGRRFGPYGPEYAGGPGYAGGPARGGASGAEATLAERFAQGDIDEVEYRARLEVLRANRPS